MNDYYSLGLTDTDRVNHAFGGGIPEGSIVLVEGVDGAGKSVLSQRIAYGVASEDAYVGYVSTELTAGEFIRQMHSLSYDVVDHLLSGKVLFLTADVDTHRNGDRRELLSRLTQPSLLWQGDVIIVDAFSAFLRNDPTFDAITGVGDEDHKMESVLTYLQGMTKKGKSVVLTVDPEAVTEKALLPIRSVADVFLQIETETVGQAIRRTIRVRRFTNMRDPVDDSIGFNVQQGRGMTVVNRTVA
ncbi:ATPase domain-containing protein [Haloarchaeobius sp. HME9146]|uniref:ATPase domain-containing protein n=1 Tax=unclassified Haloarchaeobius TaxID=2614452 RepID=UPI0021C04BE8|nr:ATPase domain-containing protein [Haloarchaeobius sp. HME9146]MCT9095205.1 AAA family ATPase [Haloarchaeobius sp. HME9146]